MSHARDGDMGVWRFPLLVLLLAVSVGAEPRPDVLRRDGVASRGTPALCTLVNILERGRQIDAIAFVASATLDTLHTGPGPVQHRIAAGHSGGGSRRAIYGQVVRVERLEGRATSRLGAAVASAGNEVVVVPWDYDASCVPVPWDRSARWLTSGSSAVLLGRLRDRTDWVGGRPTFDLTPGADTYHPAGYARDWGRDSILTAEEFLGLYERLPDHRTFEASPDSAIAPVLRWQREHPELARKPVARELIDQLLFEAEDARYKLRPSFIAGTYRVVYRLPSGDSVAFFARTERHPHFVNWSSSISPADSGPYKGRRIVGHGVNAQAAPTLDELPLKATAYGRGYSLQGSIELLDAPIASGADTAVYSAEISLDWAAQLLAADSATRLAVQTAAKRTQDAGDAQYERTGSGYLGRFVLTRAGRAYYAMRVDSAGAEVLTVRAERISDDYMKPRNP
jgi:hypothetical protein